MSKELRQIDKNDGNTPVSTTDSKNRKCPIYTSKNESKGGRPVHFKDNDGNDINHINPFLELTGTQNFDLATQIVGHSCLATHIVGNEKDNLDLKCNVSMQALAEAQVQDVVEAQLVTQAQALYSRGMNSLGLAGETNSLNQAQFHTNSAVKLLRLHNETIEALGRYRRKGEQKVVVQYVNVNDGGQAIVGSILNGGGVNRKNGEVIS